MKVVLVGGGEIAYQIARELDERLDIVVVEEDPDEVARFEKLDVQVIRGSAADVLLLRGLEIAPEDHFVACSESDEQNIIAALAAKRTTGVRTICFVTQEEHYRAFVDPESGEAILDIDRLISPPNLLAEEIARIVLVPRAIDVNTFLGGRIWLQEYRLSEHSKLVGRTLDRLDLPVQMLAVAVTREEELHIPRGATVFEEGDKVTFMGTQKALRALDRKHFRDVVERVSFVTIIGGGEMGLALARRLQEDSDLELKLIEKDSERCEYLASELPRVLVLNGDGTDLELLELEQVYRSDVLVSLTSDDEKNLLCSLLAREMEIPKVITRVEKASNIYLFDSVGIDVPLNPKGTAIRSVLNSLEASHASLLATVEQGKGNVLDLVVPADFEPTRVRDLPQIQNMIIGAVVRNYTTFVPGGNDRVRAGDRLLVFCTQESSEVVTGMFE